ncbi:hypothetical protein BKA82DRAFT_4308241 [Pisolithus tinctorius]|nr:hypothetical protein BKA82DRAFT_4308241 [Pisolithus tinctorius]
MVKGIEGLMPPLLTSTEVLNDVDAITNSLCTLQVDTDLVSSSNTPRSPPSRHRVPSVSTPMSPTYSMISSPSTSHTHTHVHSTHHPFSPPPSSGPPAGPIIYTHIHSLRGLLSSQYIPHVNSDLSSQVEARARPLGGIVAQCLASHGYGLSDVDIILDCYRQSHSMEPPVGNQFVMHLAWEGLPVAEGNFLLAMIRRWC